MFVTIKILKKWKTFQCSNRAGESFAPRGKEKAAKKMRPHGFIFLFGFFARVLAACLSPATAHKKSFHILKQMLDNKNLKEYNKDKCLVKDK